MYGRCSTAYPSHQDVDVAPQTHWNRNVVSKKKHVVYVPKSKSTVINQWTNCKPDHMEQFQPLSGLPVRLSSLVYWTLSPLACWNLEISWGPRLFSSEKFSEGNRRGSQEILITRVQSSGLGMKYCLVNRLHPPYISVWAKIQDSRGPRVQKCQSHPKNLGMHPV